jgi:hypothetical protein
MQVHSVVFLGRSVKYSALTGLLNIGAVDAIWALDDWSISSTLVHSLVLGSRSTSRSEDRGYITTSIDRHAFFGLWEIFSGSLGES